MAVNLSIKNVPEPLAATLRARAERNHRSLQGELMAILEQAVHPRVPLADLAVPQACTVSIEEAVERSRKLFPKGTPSSTGFIRTMRNGRYGEAWAKTGRNVVPE
jgi:antitoxin FitA